MKNSLLSLSLGLVGAFGALACPVLAQTMKVDSLSGPITANEIASFKTYVTSLTPAADNSGNNWAQGKSGEQTKAMGLMYEATGDLGTLDQMIRFADAVLSERNDLAAAPTGQYTIWTGRIDPVWPNATTAPIATGGEQGDPVGHLAYCARLILQNPAIWSSTVGIGDPHGYGATYYARAATYVAEADYSIDHHLLLSELDLSHSNQLWFAAADPYKGGTQVPWNQVMMFIYGFQNLAACHSILGDDPVRAAHYDAIVQANLNWFFTSGNTPSTDSDGRPVYDWGYAMPNVTGEDSNHGSLDLFGFYRAYLLNRYGLSISQMTPFGNVTADVLTITVGSNYAGTVDGNTSGTGHKADTTYLRAGYFPTADFRSDQYANMCAGLPLGAGSTTTATDSFSRLMFVKNLRYVSGLGMSVQEAESLAVTSSGATTSTSADPNASGGVMDFLNSTGIGQSCTYTTTSLPAGTYQIGFRYRALSSRGQHTVLLDGVQLGGTIDQYAASASYPTVTLGTVTWRSTGTHTLQLTVTGKNAAATGYILAADCFYFSAVTAAPTVSVAAGGYSAAQTIALESLTPGVAFRYTTNGTTPTETTGTLYTGAFTVSATATLKAIAYKTGYLDSAVTTSAYTIAPTLTSSDIGTPPLAGSNTFASGVYTVKGSGTDIYGTADQFHYANESASGDFTILARVASQTNTNAWAKSGVMIRASTAAGSAYVGIYITPSNGVDLQYRSTTGGSAVDLARVAGVAVPFWVKLVRVGNTFTGYCASDGVGWTNMGSITVSMSAGVTAGLAVCSHSTTALNTTTFDNLAVH